MTKQSGKKSLVEAAVTARATRLERDDYRRSVSDTYVCNPEGYASNRQCFDFGLQGSVAGRGKGLEFRAQYE